LANVLVLQTQTQQLLDITIRADNDFYSVVSHLEERNLEPTWENVASLPPFLPCPRDNNKPMVRKTGLGSSAALVTSLVASLLHAFGLGDDELDKIHNLAQICHCHAQGKVGSGFDVSSAVYGSHVYRRFPKSTTLVDLLIVLDDDSTTISKSTATTLVTLVDDDATWGEGGVVSPLQMPGGLQLLLADVCGGSESPSMARNVLQWKQESNRESYWEELAKINERIVTMWKDMSDLKNVDQLSQQTLRDWEEEGCSSLRALREAFLQARTNLKSMGEAAQVPIEPDAQTALADATMELPGVVAAVVPGAGGYDAMACLYIDSQQVRDSIVNLWANWKNDDAQVCPLAVQGASFGDGLRRETDFGL
jgi:phosphomevalonate kinase